MQKTRRFDIAELLESESGIQRFLEEVAQTGNADDYVHALGIAERAERAARAKGGQGLRRAGSAPDSTGDAPLEISQ